MTRFELLPSDASPFDPTARPLRWSRSPTSTGTVTTDLGWDLHRLGAVPVAAGDLLRVTAAAYLADRLTSRGRTFTRSIDLTVHVLDPTPWMGNAAEQVADLLYWLTGDRWTVRAVPAKASDRPDPTPRADEVTLLSGSLDSLCGALDRLRDGTNRLLLSHGDGTTAVRHAQRLARSWLEEAAGRPPRHVTVTFSQTGMKQESSTRSRSLLFAGLAIAAAAACRSSRVIVPENGYTSINPPLVTTRGGALSTRSTHPTTFARISALLATLGMTIEDDVALLDELLAGLEAGDPALELVVGHAEAVPVASFEVDALAQVIGNPTEVLGVEGKAALVLVERAGHDAKAQLVHAASFGWAMPCSVR
jgi:hypothetical protein